MMNSTKNLFLLVVVMTVAGCAGWEPLFKSENPSNPVKATVPTFGPSDEAVVLLGQPLISEPPIPEPTLLH